MMALHEGLVERSEYTKLDSHELLLKMSEFSRGFLDRNAGALSAYAETWTPDPLGNWSRRWEYPFIGERILSSCQEAPTISWLDAGSGVTFFPFWVKTNCPDIKICCIDFDRRFMDIFRQLNEPVDGVDFMVGDLTATQFGDRSFDLISCISVIEHMSNPSAAIREFARLLKPGGKLLLTFDIGLDGFSTLDPVQLEEMAKSLRSYFDDPKGLLSSVPEKLRIHASHVDTDWVSRHWPERLPWKYPRVSALKAALKKHKFTLNKLKILTFSCHELVRR